MARQSAVVSLLLPLILAGVLFLVEVPDLVASGPIADDVVLNGAEGLVAYVNKKGANIRVHRTVNSTNGTSNGNTHGFSTTGVVEIFLDTLEEVDKNAGKLGGKYKTSSFANVDFKVETKYNVSLPLGEPSNVTADCLNCSATLTKGAGEGAKISLAVCVINSNTTLDLNGELTNVTAGQLKITFTVAGWTFAAADNKLAVDITIKVPPGRYVSDNSTDSKGKPAKFSLGADSFIEFSRQSYEDGDWKTMPDGYPEYTSHGANNIFRLILGHFTSYSLYDPNVEVGYTPYTSNDSDGSAAPVMTTSLLLTSLLAVAAFCAKTVFA